VLATLTSVTTASYAPPARATIPAIVGEEHLAAANSVQAAIENLTIIVGPAIGGLVIAAFGVATCFWLNAASYIGVIAALYTIRRRPRPSGSPQRAITLIGEALRYVKDAPTLLGLFALLVVAGTFGANFNLVLPLFTKVVLHANADAMGYLFAAQGLGSLIGALTMTALGGLLLDPRRIALGALLFALMELVFLIIPGFSQSMLLLVVIGWAFAVYTIGTNTFVQVRSPDRMQGRMVSLYSMLFVGVTPIGNFFAAVVAHRFGPAAAVWLGGALTGMAAVAVLLYLTVSRRRTAPVVATP